MDTSLPISTPLSDHWLTRERDACGVGFLADQQGRASHDLVQKALLGLSCMEHRGGCGSDLQTGDGAGVTTAIPWLLLEQWAQSVGVCLPPRQQTGVAMVFLPQDTDRRELICGEIVTFIQALDWQWGAWRQVPVRPERLGSLARENQPAIWQLICAHPHLTGEGLEQELYLLRKRLERHIRDRFGPEALYFVSFSSQIIVYKGMVQSAVLQQFYADLEDPAYISAFASYHRRFSTNTLPRWPLAQPMRYLAHNGEINTYLGNVNWMVARERTLAHPRWADQIEDLKPIVDPEASDSAGLDGTLELLIRSGYSPLQGMMMLIPEAFRNQPELRDHPEVIEFYEFFAGIQEAWDGPAMVVFCDGHWLGAILDRNGLRPARYAMTRDGLISVGSEAGAIPLEESEIVEKGRLGPGQMLAVDLQSYRVLKNWEIKQQVASEYPYGEWLRTQRQDLEAQDFSTELHLSEQELLQRQTAFGYTLEDVEMVVEEMAASGKEPTFCMGDDTPLAVLSQQPHPLYDYFKQRFAQVTNPPIDPLRESLVMSLNMYLGARGNFLHVGPEDAQLLHLRSPVLNEAELQTLQTLDLACQTLAMVFPIGAGPEGLEGRLRSLQDQAVEAVQAGAQLLILSDRDLNEEQALIPPLLAVGAIHHHLIQRGLRLQVSLVVETAHCWSTHHFACLIGYGASAICPYLAYETVRQWWHRPKTKKLMETGKLPALSIVEAQLKFRAAIEAGLLKILSKMGISQLTSYHAAQIFECIGLSPAVIDLAFRGTISRVGGMTLTDLAREVLVSHCKAFPLQAKRLENYGFIQARPKGEFHINSPEMAKRLHQAIGSGSPDHYELYRQYLQGRPPTALRDLLEFHSDRQPIEISEVESAADLYARFATGGMSLGALSKEAHEVLAIAMNRIGGKSNSGEGGEDPNRFGVIQEVNAAGESVLFPGLKGLQPGDTANSAIKQVASGRFGVTPQYLINAKQIEIKVAQGAKPGEGGQLPGRKVSDYIAKLRRSKPGVPLISPPPHHDIYSIEDLAQLIFDLHQINPEAKVSVKLVSEIGIGTIAAGVAKANADVIQISGHDGGTGASPLSSIKHAGVPWELGLTEVHRALMENDLRDRVILRVDGGIRTGWEVVMAAMLGAEEFGFGTVAMIAEGCIMARICHTNNCPVGVTSQKQELRARFPGTPDHVVTFFAFVAEEVRQILAQLGYRSLSEVIGRADLLGSRADVQLAKTPQLDLSCLLELPGAHRDPQGQPPWLIHEPVHSNGPVLEDQMLQIPEIGAAIETAGSAQLQFPILSTDRAVGGRIAGTLARRYGDQGFAAQGGHLDLRFTGSAGQSFGVFTLPGMSLTLVGEANDYVGKSMNGGEIIVMPPPESQRAAADHVILGNTCLYGATGGFLFANGRAGERFAVRNSGAIAVIEGSGDHCCEYMTGGVVVVLGSVGRNVGAGMTGGMAYVLDQSGDFAAKVNSEIVRIQRVQTPAATQQVRELIQRHQQVTASARASWILCHWEEVLPQFWQVIPPSEDNTELTHPIKATADVAD